MNHTNTILLLALIAAALSVPSFVVDAATAICIDKCVLNQTMTCDIMVETMEFHGDCCSLSDNPVTGDCVVTVSNGSCGWQPRCSTYGCDCSLNEEGEPSATCVIPYTSYSAGSEEECPASSYNISGTECTIPWSTLMEELCNATIADAAAAPTVAPSISENEESSAIAAGTGTRFTVMAAMFSIAAVTIY